MKKIIALFLSLFVLLSFPSCGPGSRDEAYFPENPPVTEASSLTPSAFNAPTPEPSPLSVAYDADFMTDDGLIAVSIHDPAVDPIPSAMPVLRTVPQEITSDMARQMAEAVFGDTPLYEYSQELSKAEIAEMIKVWEEGVLDESILASYGEDAPQYVIDDVRDGRLGILEFYRNAYAYARDEITPVPCQWKFWPLGHYTSHDFDYAGTDPSYTSSFPFGESVSLEAKATVGVLPYHFWASNFDRGDFRNHSLSIFIIEPDGLFSGASAEEDYARRSAWYTSMDLCSPEPATAQQLEDACAWAEELAADMGLGEFQFTVEAVDNTEYFGGWQIELYGLPVYQGFPVCRRNAFVRETVEDAMYEELFYIVTNNDGTLVNLSYDTPLVVEQAEPVPLMDADQTRAAAESLLRSFTYSDLDPSFDPSSHIWDEIGAELTGAGLALDSVRVGYTRIADGSSAYLLVPSVVYSGKAEITETTPDSSKARDLLELYLFGHDPYGPVFALDLRDGSRLY